jgi:hypothetical protein
MIIEAAIIPFLPWLTEAWLWSKSVYIAVISSTIYHWGKPNGFCENVNSAGYDVGGVFYCL